jgi:cell division protein FtsL
MTIVEPYKKISIINILIFVFSLLAVGVAILLIVLYNTVINFEHKISAAKLEMKKIETETAELKENLFNLLGSDNLKKVAEENGLVEDKNPEYFKLKQWQIGLNF